MYEFDYYYNVRLDYYIELINSLESRLTNVNGRINSASNYNLDKKVKNLLIKDRIENSIYSARGNKKALIDNYEVMIRSDITNSYHVNGSRIWTTNKSFDKKLKKQYFCPIDKNKESLTNFTPINYNSKYLFFLSGKELKVPGFGKVIFESEYLIKDGMWNTEASNPLLSFNTNNKYLRDYMYFFYKIKDQISGKSPEWIDNYIFME